eukprot:CAMPEP_0170190156 /NCGR_PEP_ID=MMETSP0040_2-20121228/48766_1 /TAXON_ID=641309 /ORGANISM="Lotharella oceanica, Strain CCMP622" /LENGTH=131 /DNA_ID=CAMNT_0010437967 /DNA_START=47 /DNA_END=443 /DNA_ORIENTATION=+
MPRVYCVSHVRASSRRVPMRLCSSRARAPGPAGARGGIASIKTAAVTCRWGPVFPGAPPESASRQGTRPEVAHRARIRQSEPMPSGFRDEVRHGGAVERVEAEELRSVVTILASILNKFQVFGGPTGLGIA